MNFVEELRWRGMLHDMMPGFDPTADSLHIGHLCSVMILRHFQRCGHKPLALIGGATGMIGDPSGKSAERNLLTEETLQRNLAGMKAQLSKFLDFDSDAPNRAELVNNYDWMKNFTFLDFAREVGRHVTVFPSRNSPTSCCRGTTSFICMKPKAASSRWVAATSGVTSPPVPN